MERYKLGLCSGRHEMPVFGYVFYKPVFVKGKSIDMAEIQQIPDQELCRCSEGIDLYVTGCGPALGAVISTCITYKIPLTLYHYDKVSGTYLPQVILTDEECKKLSS